MPIVEGLCCAAALCRFADVCAVTGCCIGDEAAYGLLIRFALDCLAAFIRLPLDCLAALIRLPLDYLAALIRLALDCLAAEDVTA